MIWNIKIEKPEGEPIIKPYQSANLAVEAMAKAEAYYLEKKESVTLKIESEAGHVVYVNNPYPEMI